MFFHTIFLGVYYVNSIREQIENMNKFHQIEVLRLLMKFENINKNLRFLIIGDLLFSLLINNNYDPYESIFKISRNEYLKRIRLRSLINTTFDLDYYKCILIHHSFQ